MPGGELRTTVRAAYERALALHRAGRLDEAEEIYVQIAAQRSGHAGARHHLGVLAHQRGQHVEAERHIRAALALAPDDADAWSNLALVFRATARLDEARAALEKALQLAPEHAGARKNLAVVLGQLSRAPGADALALLERARALAPANIEVLNELGLRCLDRPGRLDDACRLFEQAVALAPRDPLVRNNLGVALKRAGRLAEAVVVLRAAEALAPDDLATLTNLGDTLNSLGDHEEAVALLRRAIVLGPDCAEAHNNLGVALGELEQSEEAIASLRRALEVNPRYAPAHHNLGNQLLACGQIDEGLAHLRQTLALDPGCVAAWYGLAITGRHVFTAEEIARLESLAAAPGRPAADEALLHFALAHALDKSGPPASAFAHAERANALRRAADRARGEGYDRAGHTALVDAVIATFTPELFARHGMAAGVEDELPVFITGLPRSGTTLVEQILCSHPRIHGAGELNDISRLAFALPGGYPRAMAALDAAALRALAERHLARLRALGGGAARVVDKMTINFLHLGLLVLLFPRAQFIHLRREPRDVALSCFFHNFAAPGLQFAFDLGDLAHFFREHDRLMAHWRAVLPRRVLEVSYEELVAEPETGSRALVEHCGVEWDDRCLRFERNPRRVRTASALQVREPVHRRAVARWRRYEDELAPFSDALAGHGAALAHAQAGRWVEALAALDATLARRPDDARAHGNRGVVLGALGRDEEAIAAYREAIRLAPAFAKTHCDLGVVFHRRHEPAAARAAFDEALRLDATQADAWHNRGLLRTEEGDLAGGEADLAEAARLNPSNAGTWNTLGATRQVLGRVDAALADYERALALAPGHVMAHYNRACAWLLRGDFARGWAEHEWRLRRPDLRGLTLAAPRWDGAAAGTVLLLAEQGLGDTLQFIRLAPLVRARARRVVAAVQAPLIPLLRGAPGLDEVVAKGGALPPFDFYAPLLSLPLLLGDPPAPSPPYLRPDPARVAHWRARLAPGELRVGLNWQGNPQFPRDFLRSLPLRACAPLAAVPGVRLHSLHRGPGLAQVETCGFAIEPLSAGFDESLGVFVDTAAAMAALDLVITTDTSLAHLAGAVGVPAWVLLSASPDWRWRDSGERCAWHPTLRLFRQQKLGDWSGPLSAMAAALGLVVRGEAPILGAQP